MRTSVVASMGTTFTHRDEVRTASTVSRRAGQEAQPASRLSLRRLKQFLMRP
jgi:hypothetical protein